MNACYPPEHFHKLFQLESNHFWFRSRNRIIQYLFSKFLDPSKSADILEVGCGTGYVLSALSKFKNFHLAGAELHQEGLAYAKKRLPNIDFIQLDFRHTFFHNRFDAIGTFDVLEHIDDDRKIMRNVYKSLKSKGLFFITVPQHMWLWSRQDSMACHKRRYSRKELLTKLKKEKFSIEFVSSFVFTLLPLMLLSRFRKREKLGDKNHDAEYDYDELDLPSWINRILEMLMFFDELLIKIGFSLPIGGSLVIVARKG